MFDSEDSEIVTNYSANPVAATLISSKNQMKRMYPTVELDNHADSILPIVLDQTVHHMVHLDQVFDMDATFDQDHFDEMKRKAIVYLAWLESPEGTPFPSKLKYSSSIDTVGDSGSDETYTVAADAPVTDVNKQHMLASTKVKVPNQNSKYQRALKLYHEDQVNQIKRSVTLERMVSELGMNPNTANVYYSTFKNLAPPK